jgi:hypothetical protein
MTEARPELKLRVRPGLRILQVIYYDPVNYPPTLNAARVLAEAGAEVLCLGYDRGTSAPLPLPRNARIKYLNPTSPGWPRTTLQNWREVLAFAVSIRREIRDFQPDLVIGYDHWGAACLLPANPRSWPPKIVHLHDIVDEGATSITTTDGLVWAAAKRNLHKFPLVVVPEIARARFLRERCQVAANYAVVGNSPKRCLPVRNDLLRQRLGLKRGPLAVVVGMMTLGAETVQAMARARGQWHLAVIGCRNDDWLNAMRQEARRSNLTDRLHILPYTDYDTVRTWLPGCDLGLAFYARSPNPNWNFMGAASVKIQEYMAAGIPSLVGMRDSLGQLADDTGALHVIEQDTESAILAGLDRLEPGSEYSNQLSAAAVTAHLGSYNCEAQLAPLLIRLEQDRVR